MHELTKHILSEEERCDARLDLHQFDLLIRQELFAFAQRNVAMCLRPIESSSDGSWGWRNNVTMPLARLILQTQYMVRSAP